MVKAALLGFGGIAQSAHVPAYRHLEKQGKVKLVAACDIDPKRFSGGMAINIGKADAEAGKGLAFYTELEEMLAEQEVDMVDICLPTPQHASAAIDLLRRGYHVLSEKPMARTYADAMAMVQASKQTGRHLMIGQCLRFFKEYIFLKELVENSTFGRPISAFFSRTSGPPVWGWQNWFMDEALSGGCLFDLHIHDVDMARHLFGDPTAASCMTAGLYTGVDIVHTSLQCKDLPVLVLGDWTQEGVDFASGYQVAFEGATVVYRDGDVMVYPRGKEAYKPALSGPDGYTKQLETFLHLLESKEPDKTNPPESAAATIKLVETLAQSAKNRGQLLDFTGEKTGLTEMAR